MSKYDVDVDEYLDEYGYGYDDDEVKYHKKTNSTKSKSKSKSKHKHEYKNCLFEEYDGTLNVYVGTYCTVCGKIGDINRDVEELPDNKYRMLDAQETLKKYPKYERIKIMDIFQKYIPVTVK